MPEQNFEDMREQAVRRVMDMQRRAQGLAGIGDEPPRHNSPPPPPPADDKTDNPVSSLLGGGGLGELIEGLNIDEEKALIALLIYILWKNGADKKLLFGLAYLIL